jgi:hypothetical protein
MLGENIGAIQPILMQNAVDLVQKQALGCLKCLQTEQILSELGHLAHVEHLRKITDIPKTVKGNESVRQRDKNKENTTALNFHTYPIKLLCQGMMTSSWGLPNKWTEGVRAKLARKRDELACST